MGSSLKLDEICTPFKSDILVNRIKNNAGDYPVFGAKGIATSIGSYQQSKPYISIIKWGAGVGRAEIRPAYSSIVATMLGILPNVNIDIYWLCYLLQSMHLEQYATNAVVPNLYFKDYCNQRVIVPDYSEQKRISNLLGRVQMIIDYRKEQLESYDCLIKARFVEMFGDPVKNNKHWDMDTLLDVLEPGRTVSYGIVQTGDDVDEGIPVFRPIDIAGGHIPKRKELKKTLPEISDKYKRTLLKGNELLITVRGSVGETFQVTEEFEGCNVGRNIVPLATDKNVVNQRFLQELFEQKSIKDWLKSITKGIALQGLNMSEFKEMPVIIPKMELQEAYVEFVKRVDKSKVAVQKALDEAQLLFDSLMQEYFG